MQKIKAVMYAMLAFACTAFAGENGQELTTAGINVGQFPHFGGNFNGKVTQSNVRLIGKVYAVYSNGVYVIQDSTAYSYSKNRGGIPDREQPNRDDHLLFDESYTYRYIPVLTTYRNEKYRKQLFNLDNKVTELTYKDWESTDKKWKNRERYIYGYDTDGKMTGTVLQQWYGNMWTNNITSTVTYDAQDKIRELTSVTYKLQFDYDPSGKHVVEIVDIGYNSSTGSWDNNVRKSYTYSGDDIATYVLAKWNTSNNTWVNEEKWSYTYNNNHQVVYSEHELWNGSTWSNNKEYNHSYSGKNEIERVEKVWVLSQGNYVNNQKITYTYNVYNQPKTYQTASWNGSGWYMNNGDKQITYYYEQYDPTGIEPVLSNANSTINVYPIPANNMVHLSADKVLQSALITVSDMTGRIIYKGEEDVFTTHDINVSSFPDGYYILSVKNTKETLISKFLVAH